MKQALKRIEATLQQLETVKAVSYPQPAAAKKRTYSFEICHTPQLQNAPEEPLDDFLTQAPGEGKASPSKKSRQPSPAQTSSGKALKLPKFNFASHRCTPQVVNSGSEANSSPETPLDVASYEEKLEQVIGRIKDTYLEGPLVDGWLESHPPLPEPTSGTLRHGSVEHLMEYVEEVCSFEGKVICESPRTSYRLCGVDASGHKWSHPCPLEQLPSVSMAIARYQKLQQLLQQKQSLETHLKQEQGKQGKLS